MHEVETFLPLLPETSPLCALWRRARAAFNSLPEELPVQGRLADELVRRRLAELLQFREAAGLAVRRELPADCMQSGAC